MVAVCINEKNGDALILQSFDEIEPGSKPESLDSLIGRARAQGTLTLTAVPPTLLQ
jgi:hypothetical protein